MVPAAKPNIVLLGVPKAGTTWLHECLTSSRFDPKPCCKTNKEPVCRQQNLCCLRKAMH